MPRCPQTQTNPAELMTTFAARHVHTSTLLLNVGSTSRTRLCVQQDPLLSLYVFGTNFRPSDKHFASHWIMRVAVTEKTEPKSARTSNRLDETSLIKLIRNSARFQAYSIFTVCIRTPFDQAIVLEKNLLKFKYNLRSLFFTCTKQLATICKYLSFSLGSLRT